MTTIPLRLEDTDARLIREYAGMKKMTASEPIRQTVLERIEEEFDLHAYKNAPKLALNSINCAFQPGQVTAVVGPSGSGKTTLLADELTGNLDGENSRNVIEILSRLAHDEGYCVIIVTRDPAIAEVSDAVFRMADGVLRQAG